MSGLLLINAQKKSKRINNQQVKGNAPSPVNFNDSAIFYFGKPGLIKYFSTSAI